MFYNNFNRPGGFGTPPQAAPQLVTPGAASPQPGSPQLIGGPQDAVMQLFWRIIMQLQFTDPQKFHVIAKELGIGPYEQHPANVATTGEFPGQPGTSMPGLGSYAGMEDRR